MAVAMIYEKVRRLRGFTMNAWEQLMDFDEDVSIRLRWFTLVAFISLPIDALVTGVMILVTGERLSREGTMIVLFPLFLICGLLWQAKKKIIAGLLFSTLLLTCLAG
jgi:hypothetical protein